MTNKIEATNTLEQCNSGCNPKFLAHLRRPTSFDETQGFGFDWFRPEYELPLTKIPSLQGIVEPLFKLDIRKLKNTYYCKGIKKITPFGKEYIPSIISMFSDVDNEVSDFIRDKQKNGLSLDIELYELDSVISDNGIAIEFKAESEFIVIEPSLFRLGELIASGYAKDRCRDINKKEQKGDKKLVLKEKIQISRDNEKYYRAENAINVKISGGYVEDYEEIKIIVHYSDGSSKQIGQSIVYPNVVARFVDIQPVNFCFKDKFEIPADYKSTIESTLAQALIVPKFLEEEKFTLDPNVPEHSDFLIKYASAKHRQFIVSETAVGADKYLYQIRDDILEIYNNFSSNVDSTVDNNDQYITYLIFIDLKCGSVGLDLETEMLNKRQSKGLINDSGKYYSAFGAAGTTSQTLDGNGWGNATIVFDQFLTNPKRSLNTTVHEIVHSLGMAHTFEVNSPNFQFYQATTDNLMDYPSISDEFGDVYANPFAVEDQKYKPIHMVLNKFQWELIYEDKSVYINTN